MSTLQHATTFRDLVVYQKSRSVSKRIFVVSKGFPKDEMYSLTDQVRRSSRSIGAQIAEAWGKRRYQRHFVSKLTDADAELQETQHWIDSAQDCGYLTTAEASDLNNELNQIGRMLNSMIAKADVFCGEKPVCLKEHEPDYLTTQDQ